MGTVISTMSAFVTADLDQTAAAVQAFLDERGVGFGSGSDASRFVVDPVPRAVDPQQWQLLRHGLPQRGRALAAFTADVYGERAICAAGVVPERVAESAEYFEPDLTGLPPNRCGWVAGFDLVADGDGALMVLEDNMRTPSGIAYAIAARDAVDAAAPVDPPPNRLDPRAALPMLADALRSSAPDGDEHPSIALLSDGPSNSAWYEHRALAAALDIPIVRREDLTVRGGRLLARRDGGPTRPVDVVYRRTDEDRLRGADGRPTWLAETLLEPLLAGTLAVVNPFGAAVADDKLVHAYVDDMVRFYCGEEPLIESVRSYDLGNPEVFDRAFERLDELVVKPRSGHGGEGVVVCPRVSPRTREDVRRAVAADPDSYIAQELVELSTEPTVCDGRLEPRHVDLRPFAIAVGDTVATAPVALTRVALGRGALIVNSSRNGGGKDTWLLD
ncbi:MAG TPA: circularly permuted type 2 ATP-grasp protein [Thermoleophilaceae bacterium]|nr:circularly permuted type 2 ATP-grasp protein [Thermoleophilaceae bacterium]